MASFLLHKKEVSNEDKNNYEPNLLTYKQKKASKTLLPMYNKNPSH